MERADHVLIVDDDAELRALLGEYLGRSGFRVSLAMDGMEMRRALDTSSPDIVVLDIMLPSVFIEHPNRVLNRNQLMDLALGREATAFDRSIDVQVSRLRTRLRDDAREPSIIKTVRNEGYVLAAAVERVA